MSVVEVQTSIELPDSQRVCEVEAVQPHSMQDRENQLVGFYVRARRAGDRFDIAKWEDFSVNWMRFVDVPPDGWVEKIEAREKLRGQIGDLSLMKKPVLSVRPVDRARAMSELPSHQTAHDFDYSTGKMKRGPGRPKLNLEKTP